MDVTVRALVLATLAAIAFATASAQISSNDNIVRIQLWDAEGLSRYPVTTKSTTPATYTKRHKLKVNLDTLYNAMLGDDYETDMGRFTRHKVRHKRRRPRHGGDDLPWRFHEGTKSLNVAVYDDDVPWNFIEGTSAVNASGVSDPSAGSAVNETRDVSPPMYLREDEQDEEIKKQLPVVPKCCGGGQNLTVTVEDGEVKIVCSRSSLTFQPMFHKANDTHIWTYESNLFETIVGNPCSYGKYKLEPHVDSRHEFYLLVNGSLFVPYLEPPLLGTKEYCMETFWNESYPAGVTVPLVCFNPPVEESSVMLIFYAVGLIISVPFLLATVCVYTFITELRDTHGKALACHSTFLAIAFSCLAATQLAGHAFPALVCTIMAYLIQFSFVSCFFWLNVICFDIYLNVRRYIGTSVSRRSMRRRFAWYCAYAILLPLILLIVTITMDLSPAVPSTYLKPNFGVKGCWFKTDESALPYFYGPVGAILLSNLVIFFFTAREFATHYDKLKDVTPLSMTHLDSSSTDDWDRLNTVLGEGIAPDRSSSPPRDPPVNFKERLKKYKKIFRTCCLLSVLMGLSWVLEVVSWAAGAGSTASVWSVFDLINALQGVVIFGIYVVPIRSHIPWSQIWKNCRRTKNGSEVAVVSERNSIEYGPGKRDYV